MPPIKQTSEREIYRLFEIGLVLKGIDGAVEIVLGILLLFTNVTDIVQAFVANELIEDPDDFFARHAQHLMNVTPHAQFIGALYLLSHGLAKAFLSAGILRGKVWAYPAGAAFFSIFALYEIIRAVGTHSLLLFAAFCFDALVIALIVHEYRRISAEGVRS
jgi:uncharacterized membrane protein